MKILGIRVTESLHLGPERRVGPLVVHFLLFLRGVAHASRIERLHPALVELRIWRVLRGIAAEHGNHFPSALEVELRLRNPVLEQDLMQGVFLELSQVGLSSSDCLGVLNGWVQVHAIGLGSLDGISRYFERHLQVTVATVAAGRISLPLEHHHAALLLDLDVVAGQVPRGLQHLRFDQFGDSLQDQVCLFEAELVGRVRNLVRAQNLLDADFCQPVLPVDRTLVLTNHLGRHSVFVSLHVKIGVQLAVAVPVLLDFDLFQALLQHRRLDLGEELANVLKAEDLVFL